MAIRPNQRRVTIIMDNDDYNLVVQAAKADRRSVSSYCNNVIMCSVDRPYTRTMAKSADGVSSRRKTYKISRLPSKGKIGII